HARLVIARRSSHRLDVEAVEDHLQGIDVHEAGALEYLGDFILDLFAKGLVLPLADYQELSGNGRIKFTDSFFVNTLTQLPLSEASEELAAQSSGPSRAIEPEHQSGIGPTYVLPEELFGVVKLVDPTQFLQAILLDAEHDGPYDHLVRHKPDSMPVHICR